MRDLEEALTTHLGDAETGWNIGSFGVIAEFHQDPDEALIVDAPLTRATARGALRIERVEGVTPIAWESLSKDPRRWQQGIALCLPKAEAVRPMRPVLTELGPDTEAIRPEDRGDILFDMGLGQQNVDFCVRTGDPDLIGVLRSAAGRPLTEPGNPAMPAILAAHPHRVALSAIGRCEVFQKIGGPDTGGTSPLGPHTHVLPNLMKAGRTHSANTPIPEHLMPAMSLHPGNPVIDAVGVDRAFDPRLFAAFETVLGDWGDGAYLATKRRIWQALDAGDGPEEEALAGSRIERTARRNALRQRKHLTGSSPLLLAWFAAHDTGAAEADPDMPGH